MKVQTIQRNLPQIRKDLRRDLQAQKSTAVFFSVKLVGLTGRKQHQLTGLQYKLPLGTGDCQGMVQYHNQLPLRMDMGSTVIHCVEKQADAFHLPMLYDLKFIHRNHPLMAL